MIRIMKSKPLIDRLLQVVLKDHDLKIETDRLENLHERIMAAAARMPQDEPLPIRPVFLAPAYAVSAPRAVAFGALLLMFGVFVGLQRQDAPVVQQKEVAETTVSHNQMVYAMASPWGALIEEGE